MFQLPGVRLHWFVFLAAILAAGCQQPIDIKQSLQVTDISTGWFDAGIVDGKNKLVPSVSFRLRNTSDQGLEAVSINLAFKFADTGEDHEEIFKQRIPFENKQTEPITVRSQVGYTGEPPQTRAEMLANSNFRDMVAVIFVRQAGAQWVELHRVPIERQLLTQ
jgi:hypothetical protein